MNSLFSKIFFIGILFVITNVSASEKSASSDTTKVSKTETQVNVGKLKITPVSISVVGLSQVEFHIRGGVPPYKYVATSGSISRGKNKATLFTPEYETTILMTVFDSKGDKATAEVFVTKPHGD